MKSSRVAAQLNKENNAEVETVSSSVIGMAETYHSAQFLANLWKENIDFARYRL